MDFGEEMAKMHLQHLGPEIRQPWPQVRNLAQILDTMFPEPDKFRKWLVKQR